MTAPSPQEVEALVEIISAASRYDNTAEDIASTILAAGYSRTADTLERAAKVADETHDRYMNLAGWFRDANSSWTRASAEGLDRMARENETASHNSFVSKANAAHSLASAIRAIKDNPNG